VRFDELLKQPTDLTNPSAADHKQAASRDARTASLNRRKLVDHISAIGIRNALWSTVIDSRLLNPGK
jgi:hypothetical protein